MSTLIASALMSGCGGDDSGGAVQGPNVLLVTLDTTRADRIGCYGYKNARTPALDAIAARGVLFEDAVAQVPLTLPSHAAILTGRLPREFGVRINNQAALGSTHPTLASIFKEHGYRTAAFVATFVLDSRFGLDRGFDVYEDEMGNVSMKSQPLEWEQPASVVADRAIAWLDSDPSRPFFAWVHFYDPHDPHRPPQPYPPTYDGEIAFMDAQLKRLEDWLTRSGRRDNTLLVVVGDHGESFGEHGEEGHGMFLYHTSMHVPLLFAHPGMFSGARRVANTVGAVDVFPTILDLLGWPLPQGLHSASLADALRTGTVPPRNVYSESEYVWHSYGWAQQRSFTHPDWKLISSTRPELYDRRNDPAERNNLLEQQRAVAAELTQELFNLYGTLVPAQAGKVAASAEAARALETLGYTQGGTHATDEFLTTGALDPKEKLHVVQNYKTARKLMKQEQYDEAVSLLRAAADEAPDALALHAALGMALVNAKAYQEALAALDQAMKLDPFHQPVLMNLGDAHYGLKDYPKAAEFFSLAVKNDALDTTAHYKLGKTLLALGRVGEAREAFERALKVFPDFPEAHYDLAHLLAGTSQFDAAVRHYREAIRLKPEDAEAHYNLGVVLLTTRQFAAAVEPLKAATRLNPQHGRAWINLGIALLSSGSPQEGKAALARATQITDSALEAYLNLAIAAERERDLQGAARAYERALQIAPDHPDAQRGLARIRSASAAPTSP